MSASTLQASTQLAFDVARMKKRPNPAVDESTARAAVEKLRIARTLGHNHADISSLNICVGDGAYEILVDLYYGFTMSDEDEDLVSAIWIEHSDM